VSADQAVTGEDRAVETSLADEVAKDYSFIQMMADLAGVSIEELQAAHRRVCGYIGGGLTPAAAISRLHQEQLMQALKEAEANDAGPVQA